MADEPKSFTVPAAGRLMDGFVDRLPAMFKDEHGLVGHDTALMGILSAVAATVGKELDEMEQRLSTDVESGGPP